MAVSSRDPPSLLGFCAVCIGIGLVSGPGSCGSRRGKRVSGDEGGDFYGLKVLASSTRSA
jgi:hypothetical protein